MSITPSPAAPLVPFDTASMPPRIAVDTTMAAVISAALTIPTQRQAIR